MMMKKAKKTHNNSFKTAGHPALLGRRKERCAALLKR
jgi:hypothetical protein